VYHSPVGARLQRDPAGYVDGSSVYEYAGSFPIQRQPTSCCSQWAIANNLGSRFDTLLSGIRMTCTTTWPTASFSCHPNSCTTNAN
jgi:hypothetical protein